jgi:hypothetical protein
VVVVAVPADTMVWFPGFLAEGPAQSAVGLRTPGCLPAGRQGACVFPIPSDDHRGAVG